MMLTKKKILEIIETIPEENFTDIKIVLNELLLFEKIERGLDDLKKGNVMSEEEVDREIDFW